MSKKIPYSGLFHFGIRRGWKFHRRHNPSWGRLVQIPEVFVLPAVRDSVSVGIIKVIGRTAQLRGGCSAGTDLPGFVPGGGTVKEGKGHASERAAGQANIAGAHLEAHPLSSRRQRPHVRARSATW